MADSNPTFPKGNLIYLALLTGRVPIVGYWVPSHTGDDVGPLPFSEVFDIEYLSNAIGVPVLDWDEVKSQDSEEMEDIGCWSVWQAVQTREDQPRWTKAHELQHLGTYKILTSIVVRLHRSLTFFGLILPDISYTAAPAHIQHYPGHEHDPTALFWPIAELTFPDKRAQSLQAPQPSNIHGALLPPDEQLACFDYLYYTAASTVRHTLALRSCVLFTDDAVAFSL